ncbi:MAG: RsmD family RNA methyltransferase [Thermoanaerobaculum sp.]
MRITGGLWAGRKVFGPPLGLPLRPTPDALREQAFAVLAEALAGAVFLDLFAGTGVVSLEALSRGAARAILVEPHPQARRLIHRNLQALGVEDQRVLVVARRAEDAVPWLSRRGEVVSVLWADPPFASFAEHLPIVAEAARHGLLVAGGLVVLEHPPKGAWELPGFTLVRPLRGAVLMRWEGAPLA